MTYTRQYWADGKGGSTPISADALNYMEAGIAAARVDWNVRTVTATTTAAVDDYILVDTTSAAVTITAPAPAAGQVFAVKWIAGTPAPTLSGTFNSTPTFVAVDQAVEFISDGTKWYRQVRPAAANLADWSQIYGKANGVASLDSNGLVPVAQLPATAPLVARLTAAWGTTVATMADVLTVDGLTPGLWQIDIVAPTAVQSQVLQGQLATANGLVLAASGAAGAANLSTSLYTTFAGASGITFATTAITATGATVFTMAQTSGFVFTARGAVRVTTGGSLKLRAMLAAAGGTNWIDMGSAMTLTRIGS